MNVVLVILILLSFACVFFIGYATGIIRVLTKMLQVVKALDTSTKSNAYCEGFFDAFDGLRPVLKPPFKK